jgi:hypothetical protein
VTDFLRSQGEPVYDENILKPRDDEDAADDDDGESDAMSDDPVRMVAVTRRCSTSWCPGQVARDRGSVDPAPTQGRMEPMVSTAKVSVAIGRDELAWAKSLARREGKSLSAVVTESLAERRRLVALAEVVAWMEEGQPPLSDAELRVAQRELAAKQMRAKGLPRRRTSTKRKPPAAATARER